MGGAKHAMMEHEENLGAATHYLVKVGKLQACSFHGEVYGGGYDDLDSDFYRFAMSERNKGQAGGVPWAEDLGGREFTDLLKEAYEDHCGDECGRCSHLMAD